MNKKSNDHQFAIRLMQHLVVPTFVLNPEREVIIWNKACERMTGLKAEDVIGTKDHWRAFYDEPRACLADILVEGNTSALEELYSSHENLIDNEQGLKAENWCTMPLASKRLFLAIDAGPIYDDHGQLIAVVETLRDMTEQRLAQRALRALAEKDSLTQLANRHSFDASMEADLLHAQTERGHFSLLLLDVDHFKQYNDTYGHHQGDECLKKVAKVIGDHSLRPTDLAARYGGEEFAIILPMADREGALTVAERIHEKIFALNEPHESSLTSDRITISVGLVSLIPETDTTIRQIIEAADCALYQAKKAGRNQVVCFDGEICCLPKD